MSAVSRDKKLSLPEIGCRGESVTIENAEGKTLEERHMRWLLARRSAAISMQHRSAGCPEFYFPTAHSLICDATADQLLRHAQTRRDQLVGFSPDGKCTHPSYQVGDNVEGNPFDALYNVVSEPSQAGQQGGGAYADVAAGRIGTTAWDFSFVRDGKNLGATKVTGQLVNQRI